MITERGKYNEISLKRGNFEDIQRNFCSSYYEKKKKKPYRSLMVEDMFLKMNWNPKISKEKKIT